MRQTTLTQSGAPGRVISCTSTQYMDFDRFVLFLSKCGPFHLHHFQIFRSPPKPPPKTAPKPPPKKKPDVKPPEFTIRPKNRSILEGMQARFTCGIDGTPGTEVAWYKDGQVMSLGKRVEIKNVVSMSTLTIKDAELNDSGIYKAVATNDGGEVFIEAELIVEGMKLHTSKDVVFSLQQGSRTCKGGN